MNIDRFEATYPHSELPPGLRRQSAILARRHNAVLDNRIMAGFDTRSMAGLGRPGLGRPGCTAGPTLMFEDTDASYVRVPSTINHSAGALDVAIPEADYDVTDRYVVNHNSMPPSLVATWDNISYSGPPMYGAGPGQFHLDPATLLQPMPTITGPETQNPDVAEAAYREAQRVNTYPMWLCQFSRWADDNKPLLIFGAIALYLSRSRK